MSHLAIYHETIFIQSLFSLDSILQLVIVLYIGLLVIDGFPWGLILSGLLAHMMFGSLLTTFPVISLLSVGFVGGLGMEVSMVVHSPVILKLCSVYYMNYWSLYH